MFDTPIDVAARRMMARLIWSYSDSPTYEDFILSALWMYLKIGRASRPKLQSLIRGLMIIITEWEDIGRCTMRKHAKNMPVTLEAPLVAVPHQDATWISSTMSMLGAHVPRHPEAWIAQLCKRTR